MDANFSPTTISMVLSMGTSVGDMVGNGIVSKAIDEIGDRAAAGEIVFTEAAELCCSIKDAARNGATTAQIEAIVNNANDLPEAMKLLKNPSAYVTLDGDTVTADDDAPEK